MPYSNGVRWEDAPDGTLPCPGRAWVELADGRSIDLDLRQEEGSIDTWIASPHGTDPVWVGPNDHLRVDAGSPGHRVRFENVLAAPQETGDQ